VDLAKAYDRILGIFGKSIKRVSPSLYLALKMYFPDKN